MIDKIDAPISVTLEYDHKTRRSFPSKVTWEGREYSIRTVDYHHKFFQGRTYIHIFSVASDTVFFRLAYNTQTLQWRLQEIADGESN